MLSITDIDTFLQEEMILNDLFSEDSLKNLAVLSYDNEDFVIALGIAPYSEAIHLIIIDYNKGSEWDIELIDGSDLPDLGQELLSALNFIELQKTSSALSNFLTATIKQLVSAGYEVDESYLPNFH